MLKGIKSTAVSSLSDQCRLGELELNMKVQRGEKTTSAFCISLISIECIHENTFCYHSFQENMTVWCTLGPSSLCERRWRERIPDKTRISLIHRTI